MDMVPPQTGYNGGAEAILGLQPEKSISIAYHSLFGSHDDLVLLEVDETLLPDILHQRVTLRGQPNEDAVLCSASKTYAVKYVGTSNSVYLIPPSDPVSEVFNSKDSVKMAVASVMKIAPGCMELVEIAPKLDKLKFLLSQNPYSYGEDSEMNLSEGRKDTRVGLYTWDDLVDQVQASDEEIRMGLDSLSAVEIDGYWRVLDDKYMSTILNMLLHDIVLNDWSIVALDEDEVVRVLETDGFPRKIAKHCLQVYSHKMNEDGSGSECNTRKLDEQRVCVQLAREILKDGKMKIEVFMEKWKQKVPYEMSTSFEMLEGEVLTENMGMDSWVYLFSVSSLPSAPAERFSALFKERPKWEWKDLQPYVRDLKMPGLSSEGLLLKYTRRSQPTADAEPVFSPR